MTPRKLATHCVKDSETAGFWLAPLRLVLGHDGQEATVLAEADRLCTIFRIPHDVAIDRAVVERYEVARRTARSASFTQLTETSRQSPASVPRSRN